MTNPNIIVYQMRKNSNSRLRPFEFIWKHGGKNVILTGSFDDWKQTISMRKEGAVFKATVNLDQSNDISYKFVVDGVWRCDQDCPNVTDNLGNVNNVLVAASSGSAPVNAGSAPAPKSSSNAARVRN